MTPESYALARKLAFEGITKTQSKFVFAHLMGINVLDLKLPNSTYKNTCNQLVKAGWMIEDGAGYQLSSAVRGMFREPRLDDPANAPAPSQPPTLAEAQKDAKSAPPTETPFSKRPANQKLWARKVAELSGFSQDDASLEALAARKFGKVS